METKLHFETAEYYVRKNWLISFFIMTGLALLYGFTYEERLSDLFFTTISLVFTYHCAYRKKGTEWLAWLLIWYPISFLWVVSRAWKEYGSNDAEVYFVSLAFAIINGYYLWNCWQLRCINKEAPKIETRFSNIAKKWAELAPAPAKQHKPKKTTLPKKTTK